MHAEYEDIRSRIQEEPTWFDTNGTPRYGAFHPDLCPSIYSDKVILFKIACQLCLKEFLVEMHDQSRILQVMHPGRRGLEEKVIDRDVHYGDPPIHHCSGVVMTCLNLRVVEFWDRTKPRSSNREWVRVPALEIEIEEDSD